MRKTAKVRRADCKLNIWADGKMAKLTVSRRLKREPDKSWQDVWESISGGAPLRWRHQSGQGEPRELRLPKSK